MRRAFVSALLLAVVFSVNSADLPDTCYPLVGCFPNTAPWTSDTRPAPAPDHPLNVATTMYLYTQEMPNGALFPMFPEIGVGKMVFNATRPNYFIFHGYGKANATAPWVMSVKDSLLRRTGGNVFIPAWGIKKVEFEQAASNARILGQLVAMTIQEAKLDPSSIHIIAHCIGSHAAGYVGKIMSATSGKKLARITSLDPAAPMFEGQPPMVRLDKEDADFIDMYHSDIEVSGMAQPAGHLDFYFNSGSQQPGCDDPKSKVYGTCSHGIAEDYCAEMMDYDCMVGLPADIVSDKDGNAIEIKAMEKAKAEECVLAGLTTPNTARGVYVILTNPAPPYCIPMAMSDKQNP